MTPDELRKAFSGEHTNGRLDAYAAADAWEAQIASWWGAVAEYRSAMSKALEDEKALRTRLAEADHALRKYGDHMTYCKGNMDAPCTCGYHDVCKPAVKRSEGRQAWK